MNKKCVQSLQRKFAKVSRKICEFREKSERNFAKNRSEISRKIFAKSSNENGQTAIMSVMFFSIVMAILTVSFMSTVSTAQSAAMNNELQASAVAAADSGVEDAKRVISYCNSNPADGDCKNIINTPLENAGACSAQVATSVKTILTEKLGSSKMTDGSGDIKVGTSGSYTEAYSCLLLGRSGEYSGFLKSDGSSQLIPLNLVDSSGNQAQAMFVAIQWSNDLPETDPNSDHATKPFAGSDFPNSAKWSTAPATMRVELAQFTSGDSTQDMTDNSYAVTIRPSTADNTFGARVGTTSPPILGMTKVYSVNNWLTSTDPNANLSGAQPLFQRDCGSAMNGYWCNMLFSGSDNLFAGPNRYKFQVFNPATGEGDYLRLQAYYNSAHFRVTAYDQNGKQLYFANVFGVDSTGRAADAFYRTRSLISLGGGNNGSGAGGGWYPDFAIETGGAVCKQLSVKASNGTDNCADLYKK